MARSARRDQPLLHPDSLLSRIYECAAPCSSGRSSNSAARSLWQTYDSGWSRGWAHLTPLSPKRALLSPSLTLSARKTSVGAKGFIWPSEAGIGPPKQDRVACSALTDLQSHAQSRAAETRGFIMRVSWLLGAVVAFGLSTAGNAASITVLPAGDLEPPTGYVPDATSIASPLRLMGARPIRLVRRRGRYFSGSGVVMNNGGQGSLGLYASPFGDTTNYMAVLGGRSEEIAYSGFNTSFGLYWGSVDTYNSLAFYNDSVLVATITRRLPLNANGGQTDYASNAYVWITALPQFDRVLAASSSNAFEFDNIYAGSAITSFSAPVPSPRPGPCCCLASQASAMRLSGEAGRQSRLSPDRSRRPA